jgi:hypothetical protein
VETSYPQQPEQPQPQQDSQLEQTSQHSGAEEEAAAATTEGELVKAMRVTAAKDQRFQKQIMLNVYIEGVRKVVLAH